MGKKTLFGIFILIGMVALLCLIKFSHDRIFELSSKHENDDLAFILMSLWFFLFGVFIEWRALYLILENKIKLNRWLFILGLALATVTFIPKFYWGQWFGLKQPIYIALLDISESQLLLTSLAGILITRSLAKKEA